MLIVIPLDVSTYPNMLLIQDVNDPLPVPICVDDFSYAISMGAICKSLGYNTGFGRVENIPDQRPGKKLVSCSEVTFLNF